MTKTVCLIKPFPPLIYFVNRINERYKVNLVIVESSTIPHRGLITKIKTKGIIGSINAVKNRLLPKTEKKKITDDYNIYFNNKWKSINDSIPTVYVTDINSQVVYERLEREKPDLILDHGTSIVKDHILETSDLALNLHWGLSPYYRGTFCTEWALINWDPYNIGVTIHKLTRIIDGGAILAQERAMIKSGDTVDSINMQLTKLGTELVIKAIQKIESGETLQFKKQDYSLGLLNVKKQFSKHLIKQIEYIENNNLIKLMLKKPARTKKLPIIQL